MIKQWNLWCFSLSIFEDGWMLGYYNGLMPKLSLHKLVKGDGIKQYIFVKWDK